MTNEDSFIKFMHLVRHRAEKGSEEYGDTSFERHPSDLLQEVLEELADVCGWSFVLATQVYKLQDRVKNTITSR